MSAQLLDTDKSTGGPLVFRPRRDRIAGLFAVSALLWCFTAFVAAIPFIAGGEKEEVLVLTALVFGVVFFLGLTAAWLLLLALRLRRLWMEAGPEGLDLVANRYEWFLCNPWGIQQARLRWEEVQGLRLWRIVNPLVAGGVQENYLLYTTRGTFVLSNVVWPAPEEMAAVIAARTGLPIAQSIAELPPAIQEAAEPTRSEIVRLRLLHLLGWWATVMGGLLLACIALILLTGQEWRGSLAGGLAAAAILFWAGSLLRRFRLE